MKMFFLCEFDFVVEADSDIAEAVPDASVILIFIRNSLLACGERNGPSLADDKIVRI